jgi:hypothetical protein
MPALVLSVDGVGDRRYRSPIFNRQEVFLWPICMPHKQHDLSDEAHQQPYEDLKQNLDEKGLSPKRQRRHLCTLLNTLTAEQPYRWSTT